MTRRDYIQIVRRISESSIDELYKVIRLIKDNMSDNIYIIYSIMSAIRDLMKVARAILLVSQ